jgi:hypothetical protein
VRREEGQLERTDICDDKSQGSDWVYKYLMQTILAALLALPEGLWKYRYIDCVGRGEAGA